MNCNSLIFNNNIISIEDFIDSILFTDIHINKIPTCEINETHNYYHISLNSFKRKIHQFELFYKNNFLIIQIKKRNSNNNPLSTRVFYLPNINTNKISHLYYNDSAILKIPKIYCT